MRVRNALLSVYDKSGIVNLAIELDKRGIEMIATSETLKILRSGGVSSVNHVSEITGFRDILGGRIKTCHPKILGGILAQRRNRKHMDELEKLGIKTIDMVVCNPFPIEKILTGEIALNTALDNIDIGGPNLIRSAAKNFMNVIVIVDPSRYSMVLEELGRNGDISVETRSLLGMEAFKLTSRYDEIITRFFEQELL